ncbi:MAG TPA: DUF4097 family beta strand repeat-containing protein [Gemmatimonadota bacterium]|nr:DUF4097 family beta strand repeat-containing protein [Gemmatimonadota bacterium]
MIFRIGAIGLAAVLVAWTPLSGPDGFRPDDGRTSVTATASALESWAQQTQSWDWRGRVDRGDAIEIKGVNGDVAAQRGSGNQVEVRVELKGRKSDPSTVEMVAIEHEGGVTICAVYPSEDRDRPNECQPGSRGRMNVKDNDVSVSFTVLVPAGVNFVGRTVNGDVEARDIEGDVQAHTVNGGVDIYASGLAEATTVNGSITVSMGRANWDGTLDFTTVNGGVTLEMPADLSCEVSISTVNGHIASDFPLTVEGRFSPRHLKGTIGNGGRGLVIKTVNGSVQIRRS